MTQNKRKYVKATKEEMSLLFDPKNDRKYTIAQDIEFSDNEKVELLNEINSQFVVDKDYELKLKRGIIADVTNKTVPSVPKVIQTVWRRHLKKETQRSPFKYQQHENGEIMKIKQRFDKEILEKFPKLKFLNKTGIQPDYEDKDVEKPEVCEKNISIQLIPQVKKRVYSFSQSKAKRVDDVKLFIPHTLDRLEVSH